MNRFLLLASSLLLWVASSSALTVVDTTTRVQASANLVAAAKKVSGLSQPGGCCPDYPFCGCPKLETEDLQATVAAQKQYLIQPLVAQAETADSCCPEFPFCGCPKLGSAEAKKEQQQTPSFEVIDVAPRRKLRKGVMPMIGRPKATRPKATVLAAAKKKSGGCCANYPYCGCPKI